VGDATKRTPSQVLRESRRRDSDRKRSNVFRTVDKMQCDGIPITFAAVARAAGVSNWLVYADGVREYVEKAKTAAAEAPAHTERVGLLASDASLRTDLELARQDNRRMREEVDRLKKAMREHLGNQLEVVSTESLRRRIDELTEANTRYRSENVLLTTELDEVRAQLAVAENDLAATRTSLRRMIRDHTSEIAT
jgi:hypothetical protein